MREDMFKVIVERPRLVNSNGYSRDGRKFRKDENAPSRLGMKHGYISLVSTLLRERKMRPSRGNPTELGLLDQVRFVDNEAVGYDTFVYLIQQVLVCRLYTFSISSVPSPNS